MQVENYGFVEFRSSKALILVATDVAARGLGWFLCYSALFNLVFALELCFIL